MESVLTAYVDLLKKWGMLERSMNLCIQRIDSWDLRLQNGHTPPPLSFYEYRTLKPQLQETEAAIDKLLQATLEQNDK